MPFLAYHSQFFVGQILVMQWQTHFGFAIGEFVAMFVPKNQRNGKEDQQVEDEGNYFDGRLGRLYIYIYIIASININ